MWNRDELYGPAKAVFKWRSKQLRFSHLIDDTKGKCYEDDTEEPLFKINPSIVLCEDVHSGAHPDGQEIAPADFWKYLYSKSWGEDCSLRIMDGQLLNMILTTLLIFERDQIVGMQNIYCYTTTTRKHPVCLRKAKTKDQQQKEMLLVDFTYYGIRRFGSVPDKESTHFLPDINASASGVGSVERFTRSSPEGFICREPRSVRHEGDVIKCLDSGLLGIKGPIRSFPLSAIDCKIPANQSATALVKSFLTDRQELLRLNRPGSQKPASRRHNKKNVDKIPDMLPFNLATNTIERDVIGWDLDKCTNIRHAQGDMLYVTDEMLRNTAQEKAADRLRKLLSMKESRRLKPLERAVCLERSPLSMDDEETKTCCPPIVQPLSRPPKLVEYLRYLEIQDLRAKHRRKKGKQKKLKKRATPAMHPHGDANSGLSSKVAGKALETTGVSQGQEGKHASSACRKSGLHGKTGAAHEKTTDAQKRRARGTTANVILTDGESSDDDPNRVEVTIIEADNQRFAQEVGGVTDSVATKNYLLDMYTHPLVMGKSLDAIDLSQEQSYISSEDSIKDDMTTGKSVKTKRVQLKHVDKAHSRGTNTLNKRGMNASGKHAQYDDMDYAHTMHTQGMKMLMGTDNSVLSSGLDSSRFSQSKPLSNVSCFTDFDTNKLKQQYSHERFGVKSRKERRLELIRKYNEEKASVPSEISSPLSEEEVIQQPITPEPTVLGKLRELDFLEYKDYKPMLPEVILPNYSVYPMQDFVESLLRALEDFVVRKEIISSSYDKRTVTTVTFTRHGVFVDSPSNLVKPKIRI